MAVRTPETRSSRQRPHSRHAPAANDRQRPSAREAPPSLSLLCIARLLAPWLRLGWACTRRRRVCALPTWPEEDARCAPRCGVMEAQTSCRLPQACPCRVPACATHRSVRMYRAMAA